MGTYICINFEKVLLFTLISRVGSVALYYGMWGFSKNENILEVSPLIDKKISRIRLNVKDLY